MYGKPLETTTFSIAPLFITWQSIPEKDKKIISGFTRMASLSQWVVLHGWHHSASGLFYTDGITQPVGCFQCNPWLAHCSWYFVGGREKAQSGRKSNSYQLFGPMPNALQVSISHH